MIEVIKKSVEKDRVAPKGLSISSNGRLIIRNRNEYGSDDPSLWARVWEGGDVAIYSGGLSPSPSEGPYTPVKIVKIIVQEL